MPAPRNPLISFHSSTRMQVFAWDTGSNLGEILPHNKKAITGDMKPTR